MPLQEMLVDDLKHNRPETALVRSEIERSAALHSIQHAKCLHRNRALQPTVTKAIRDGPSVSLSGNIRI